MLAAAAPIHLGELTPGNDPDYKRPAEIVHPQPRVPASFSLVTGQCLARCHHSASVLFCRIQIRRPAFCARSTAATGAGGCTLPFLPPGFPALAGDNFSSAQPDSCGASEFTLVAAMRLSASISMRATRKPAALMSAMALRTASSKRAGVAIEIHVCNASGGDQRAVFAAAAQGIRFRFVDFGLGQHHFEIECRHDLVDGATLECGSRM